MQHAAALVAFVLSDCCTGQVDRLAEAFEAAARACADLSATDVKSALLAQLPYLASALTQPYQYPDWRSSSVGAAAGDSQPCTPLTVIARLVCSGLQTHGPQAGQGSSAGSMGGILRICAEDSRWAQLGQRPQDYASLSSSSALQAVIAANRKAQGCTQVLDVVGMR